MNLDFSKLCGKHSQIYEAYYRQVDPKGTGTIEAMTGAKFLKKSGLSDIVLSRVWDLADANGKGYLDRPGFFIALKMVSVAQAGETVNMKNIYLDTENPPKVGEIPKSIPPKVPAAPVMGHPGMPNSAPLDWSISVIDRLKYEQLFESLKPVNGMLPGNKVKGVLLDSKLPMDTLGKIWDLADQDRDGNLDKHEFLVAMHLVYKTLEKRSVPDVLPPELRKQGAIAGGGPPPKPAPPVGVAPPAIPKAPSAEGFGDGGFVANFPKDIAPPPALPPAPGAIPPMTRVPPIGAPITTQPLLSQDPLIPIGAPPSVTANADWVVTPTEMKRYEVMFRDSDRDKDGLVSGFEVKNIFLQSGVPQNCLAHIWAVCDTNQSGKLTLEQFALAMWMVERKQKGIEPPQVLTASMVPPSMRGIISGVELQVQEAKPTYSNPELEMISKEIEELAKERRALETEIAQKETDIRVKNGEVRSLQSELDTLSATLKQLEHQRGEAEKRLDDLKNQVNRIREQCQKQEDTINEQEGELNAKRSEFQKLKDEETALQKEYDDNSRELQKLTNHLQNTQLQISSVRSMVTQLMETQRQMTDALLICRAAIESENIELVSEYQLKMEPELEEARRILEKKLEEPKDDPFGEKKTSPTSGGTLKNGFAMNGFDSDPFGANDSNKKSSAIGGFDDSFNASSGFDSGFDAFGSSSSATNGSMGGAGFGQPAKDPFGGDAFGGGNSNAISNAITPEPGKDDFDSDPFAALHAPTGKGQVLSPNTQKSGPPARPESPSPALPPKKSKVPPPRPAPPRPLQGPPRPAQPNSDAFGSSATNSSGSFADFADFDNKLPSIPSFSTPFNTNTNTNTNTQVTSYTNHNSANITTATIRSTTTTTTAATKSSSNQDFFTQNTSSLFDLSTPTSTDTLTVASKALNTSVSASLTSPTVSRPTAAGEINSFFTLSNLTSSAFSISTPNVNNINPLTSSSSSVTSALSFSTQNPITTNQLTRSTTPLVQQVISSNLFDTNTFTTNSLSGSRTTAMASTARPKSAASAFADFDQEIPAFGGGTSTIGVTNSATATPLVTGPTDFSDDPFKDYRYDDLCNIQDPFADDEDLDPEKIFKDIDFPAEAVTSYESKVPTPSAFVSMEKQPVVSNEFANKFDAFQLNPSPVPSNKSTDSSSTLNNAFGVHKSRSNSNSIHSKSQSSTPNMTITQTSATTTPNLTKATTGSGNIGANDAFGNFADFDAFSSNNNNNNNNNNNSNNDNISKTTKESAAFEDKSEKFFDAFADFDQYAATKKTACTLDANANAFDAFSTLEKQPKTLQNEDPFGLKSNNNFTTSTTTKSQTTLNAFDDDDDAFGFNNNNSSNKNNANNNFTIANMNESKVDPQVFDAFSDTSFSTDFFKASPDTVINNNLNENNHKNIKNNNNNNNNSNSNDTATNAGSDSDAKNSDNFFEAFNTSFSKFDPFTNLDNTKDTSSAFGSKAITNPSLNNFKDFNKSPVDFDAAFGGETASGIAASAGATVKNPIVLAKRPNLASNIPDKVNMNNLKLNAPSSSPTPVKLPEKFASDYSKPETFDADLEEALQRSMIDQ